MIKPLERLTYWVMGVDPDREQDWKQYTFAMLLFSLVSCLFTYAILRLQQLLPLNPQGFGALSPDLAFNTAASFTTNTNWQSYTGESTMSYLLADGGAGDPQFHLGGRRASPWRRRWCAASRGTRPKRIGNFWVDLVRITYYLLLPICVVFADLPDFAGDDPEFQALHQGEAHEPYTIQVQKTDDKGQPVTTNVAVMVQAPKLDAKGQPVMTNGVAVMVDVPKLDDKGQPMMTNVPVMVDQKVEEQSIAQGPMASQVAIKMLGTNGGGYTNANAAHPFENPTPLSNFIQMLSIFAIGSGLTYYLGRMTQKPGARLVGVVGDDGSCSWRACLLCWWAEARGQSDSPATRRRPRRTATWRARKCASASSIPPCSPRSRPMPPAARSIRMHDSFTAAGRVRAAVQHPTGRNHHRRRRGRAVRDAGVCRAGGVHRRVDGRAHAGISRQENPVLRSQDVHAGAAGARAFDILGFAAWASVSHWGVAGLNNSGPHGLSEILYAYSSGQREQRQRVRRAEREHALAQHDHRHRHAGGTFSDDRAHHGHGGLARAQEDRAAQRRHVPGFRLHLCDAAARHGPAGRRAQFPARPDARADCRTFPDRAGQTLLTHLDPRL